MWLQRFTKSLFLSLLLCLPVVGQQANGVNYDVRKEIFGLQTTDLNDTGVQNVILTTPIISGASAYSGWGRVYIYVISPDAASSWGVAIYQGTTKKCSQFGTTQTPVAGWNSIQLTGCGVPASNTSYTIAQLSASATQLPAYDDGVFLSTGHCPGTAVFSGFVAGSSFPTTLGTTTAQTFCYTAYAELLTAGGEGNGRWYQGKGSGSGVTNAGVPFGPWSSAGEWFGSANSVLTYINFSDGLSNGVAPTTTTLNNSTHGSACTWQVTNPNSALTGSTGGSLPTLLSPAIVSSTGYGGAGTIAYQFATGTGDNYLLCTIGSSFNNLWYTGVFKHDIPQNDASGNWYDTAAIQSADGLSSLHFFLRASGNAIVAYVACEGAAVIFGTGGMVIPTNTVYRFVENYNTAGALSSVSWYDTNGRFAGSGACNTFTGSHPANGVKVAVFGAEPESAGHHIWINNLEINSSAIVP